MTVDSGLCMPVPPDDLALREVERSGTQVGERGIERASDVAKHPLAGLLGLGVEVVHRGSRANEERLGLVNGDDGDGVGSLSRIVLHHILHGLAEVLRLAAARSNRGVLTIGDGGHEGCDAS